MGFVEENCTPHYGPDELVDGPGIGRVRLCQHLVGGDEDRMVSRNEEATGALGSCARVLVAAENKDPAFLDRRKLTELARPL